MKLAISHRAIPPDLALVATDLTNRKRLRGRAVLVSGLGQAYDHDHDEGDPTEHDRHCD